MVILVFFLVISVNRRLFRCFGSYSGISVILVNRRTGASSVEYELVYMPNLQHIKFSDSLKMLNTHIYGTVMPIIFRTKLAFTF